MRSTTRLGVSLFTPRLCSAVDRADWKNGNCFARRAGGELAEVLRHVGLVEVAERGRERRETVRGLARPGRGVWHAMIARWRRATRASCFGGTPTRRRHSRVSHWRDQPVSRASSGRDGAAVTRRAIAWSTTGRESDGRRASSQRTSESCGSRGSIARSSPSADPSTSKSVSSSASTRRNAAAAPGRKRTATIRSCGPAGTIRARVIVPTTRGLTRSPSSSSRMSTQPSGRMRRGVPGRRGRGIIGPDPIDVWRERGRREMLAARPRF